MSIDLLVLCRRKASAARRWLSGSLTEQLVRGASVPVLVLGEESASLLMPSRQAGYPFRALVPLDGSDVAQAALAPAAELVAALSAPAPGALHLARVVVLPDARGNGENERSTILQQARSSLERAVADLRQGLIAMATRGCGESPRGGACSVTARVLHTTRLPLLIVPPQYVGRRGHLARDEAIVA